MAFSQFVKVTSVIDLKSTDKTMALKELAMCLTKSLGFKKHKPVIDEILRREEAASTFVGQGLAIPQTRAQLKNKFAIAVGRSVKGVNYDAARSAKAHIIVLLISDVDTEQSEVIDILSEIDSFFKAERIQKKIISSKDVINIRTMAKSSEKKAAGGTTGSVKSTRTRAGKKVIDPIISHSVALAKEIKAAGIVVFSDAVKDNSFLDQIKFKGSVLIVTSDKSRFDIKDKRVDAVIQAPAIPASRTGQIKIGVLLALSRNLIKHSDKLVCLSGNSKIGKFDTFVSLDIAAEYEFFLTDTNSLLPQDVKPEVLERVLTLAGEISVEGREGRAMGTIFILGDTNTVSAYVRQLIINPFRGYSEVERNILDPALGETIKEFSAIDGAFIVTGDGIVLSAGSYLRPVSEIDSLPGGLGARHTASAGITACTSSLAITISESTGMITIFKNGSIMMTISKPIEKNKSIIQKIQ